MQRCQRSGRPLALAAVVMLAMAGCAPASPPPLTRLVADVAELAAVVPKIEELGVTDFEASPYCRNLAYSRGTFGDLAQDGCERTGTVQFDDLALADHARLAEAVAASAVSTDRILNVRYDAEGVLATAWFQLQDDSVTEDWAYLYDPTGIQAAAGDPDSDFTRIDADWWFVRSRDD